MPPKKGTKKAASAAPKSSAKNTKAAVSRAKYEVKKKGKVVGGKITDINEDHVDEEEEAKEEKKSKKEVKPAKSNTKATAVNEEAIKQAISELIKYDSKKDQDEKKKSQLFEDSEVSDLYLQITNVKFFSKKQTFKAKKIDIPNSIYNLKDEDSVFDICLFVKDDIINEELLEQIESSSIPYLTKIISAKELKGEYHSYEARRRLASSYNLFLSDDSLITSLPKLLGKIFYQNSTKTPIPIKTKASASNDSSSNKFSITTVKNQISKVLNQISFVPPMGVNISLKIGNLNQELSSLLENAKAVINYFDSDAYNIRIIQLKLKDSPSLPVYINQDNLYTEEDVIDETSEKSVKDAPIVKLSAFEKGLVELALDEEQVNSVIGKKVKKVDVLKKKFDKKNSTKAPKVVKQQRKKN